METTTPQPELSQGARELADFLEANGITFQQAADALNVSKTSVIYWVQGDQRPKTELRERIEKWTKGLVKTASWRLPKDDEALGRIKPFEPTPTSDVKAA